MSVGDHAPKATATGSGELPLSGKSALVTGVSRRKGIGFAIAVRLAELGASVHIHHFAPHDANQPWGSDDLDAVRAGIRARLSSAAEFGDTGADLADASTLAPLMADAKQLTGRVDVLVCNHARSGGDGSLFDMTPERLDGHWQVNTRSTILLTRLFAEQYSDNLGGGDPTRPGERREGVVVDEHATGRVFWMTSGQQHGPMPGEVAYASSKAALAGLTATVASELLPHGIILNTVNPGPVNTGYLDPDVTDRPLDDLLEHIAQTPFRRFGRPTDPARLIGWLAADDARWIVGQVITSDGGFALS
ncbi:SDR family oxidoreductase [Phytoactinopolyspora limicola]|uniref:SDR family oxidoreductase n=1 Tax=Phytoactinopolyspora limicola TaxID=2715536 RepID=UPI00140A1C26|nr:SDR family oxidoreductase [Phytoactinopolyspora limicola]